MTTPQIQQILEQQYYSKVALAALSVYRFFVNATGGQDQNNNIDLSNQIDANSLFQAERIELNLMRSDGAPVDSLALAQIGLIVRNMFFQIKLNNTTVVYTGSVSSLIKPPLAVAAAGASAYSPDKILNGGQRFNVPLMVRGGQNISVELLNPSASATALITAEFVLFGTIDRTKVLSGD
jgi:hypothetical protein